MLPDDTVNLEITYSEIRNDSDHTYALADLRDAVSVAYGCIPGASAVSEDALSDWVRSLPSGTTAVLYSKDGAESLEEARKLVSEGIQVRSLSGGYIRYVSDQVDEDIRNLSKRQQEITESISGRFYESIYVRFREAIEKYSLLKAGDHVAVCISGGKDSMLMAKLFQKLQEESEFPFSLTFLVMDPGYSKENRELTEKNARLMGIPVSVFESSIFDAVDTVDQSPCYLCARMRRGYLYKHAQDLGCNKIALGHHYDDVIETILMGLLYGAQIQTMMPKIHSTNFPGMELIRPMYLIREEDVKAWRDVNKLHFLQCACHFTETCTTCRDDGSSHSKRQEVKKLISSLKSKIPDVEDHIFRSVEDVNLDEVIAYKENGTKRFV